MTNQDALSHTAASNDETQCATEPASTQQQHYINRSLMKRWSKRGRLGVVCAHHRGSVTMPLDDLHCVRSLWSADFESQWNAEESRAAAALDGLLEMLGPDRQNLEAAHAFLSIPVKRRALIDFVVLHYARSLQPILEQWIESDGALCGTEIEAGIDTRREQAQGYYDCGIELSVLPPEHSVGLGVAPVFDVRDWYGPAIGDAHFIMPLTPRLVIAGTLERPSGDVSVVNSSAHAEGLLEWQIAGYRGLFSTPYLICEPKSLQRFTDEVLQRTEGGNRHWHALSSRIVFCGNAVDSRVRREWNERFGRYRQNLGWLRDENTTHSRKRKIHGVMAQDARKMQIDLDALGIPICACEQLYQDPDASVLWESLMPPKLCSELRKQPESDGVSSARSSSQISA